MGVTLPPCATAPTIGLFFLRGEMNNDIRISVSLVGHPKVKRLMRTLGPWSFYSLISLWTYAAVNKPDGNLTGMDAIDISIAANWDGDETAFFDAICQMGFVDCRDGKVVIHDWAEHNPYAIGAKDRSNRSRFNKMKSHYPELHKSLSGQGKTHITADEYQAVVEQYLSSTQAPLKQHSSPEPIPVPTPTPTPKEEEDIVEQPTVSRPRIPYTEIVSFLNEKVGGEFKATTRATRTKIKARWNEGFRLEDFRSVIEFKADEWLTSEKMVQFLRPDTLFGTKFEGYLQAARAQEGGGGSLKVNKESGVWSKLSNSNR